MIAMLLAPAPTKYKPTTPLSPACRNLLKVVFATGTLAAGINMPARTTVISALGRMTDDGPQLMPHNELLQMAGRAGRRGYDTAGFCVVLQTR